VTLLLWTSSTLWGILIVMFLSCGSIRQRAHAHSSPDFQLPLFWCCIAFHQAPTTHQIEWNLSVPKLVEGIFLTWSVTKAVELSRSGNKLLFPLLAAVKFYWN
jgi:hypothetical protein